MARGVRKSAIERKQTELNETRESIVTYENALIAMRQKEKDLLEEIEYEEVRKLNETLRANNLSVDDVMSMIESNNQETA